MFGQFDVRDRRLYELKHKRVADLWWLVAFVLAANLAPGCKRSAVLSAKGGNEASPALLPPGCLVAAEIRPRRLAAIGVSVRSLIASRTPASGFLQNVDFERDIERVRFCRGSAQKFVLLIDGSLRPDLVSGLLAGEGHTDVVGGSPIVKRDRLWLALKREQGKPDARELVISADRGFLQEVLMGPGASYFRHADRPVAIAIDRTELARLAARDPRISPVVSSLESLEMELTPTGEDLETMVNLTGTAPLGTFAQQFEEAVKTIVASSGATGADPSRISVVQDQRALRVLIPVSPTTLATVLK